MLVVYQALTLSFCIQWPVGPVDVKSYWPDIFLLIKKTHYKSKDASLTVIYFVAGDLLSCFRSVCCTADNVAAGIV